MIAVSFDVSLDRLLVVFGVGIGAGVRSVVKLRLLNK